MTDNKQSFRVCIIGCGHISEQHLSVLAGMANIEVVGVCDLSRSLAKFTAKRFDVDDWFTDYHQMLKEVDCNVVHVLTPPATHVSIVRECILKGCDVIVEKPISLSHDSFLKLWEFAQKHGRRLVENQNYRFNSPIIKLREDVQSGCLGRVEEIEVRINLAIRKGGRLADENVPHPSHSLPAGAIHEFITHFSYLFLDFLPSRSVEEIDAVHAHWSNKGGAKVFKFDDLDAFILAGNIHGRLRFSARQFPDCFVVHVRGSKGYGIAELFQPSYQIVRLRPVGKHLTPLVNSLSLALAMTRAGFGGLWNKIRNRTAYEGLHHFVNATYNAWGSKGQPPVGFHEMNEAIRLSDALLDKGNKL